MSRCLDEALVASKSANRLISGLSPSGQDFNVDVHKRVETGKMLHQFCFAEYPWTVLDPTVNMVFRVDDLEILCAAHLETWTCARLMWRPVACKVLVSMNLPCPLLLLWEGSTRSAVASLLPRVSRPWWNCCAVWSLPFFVLQACERVLGLRRSGASLVSSSSDWTTHWTQCYQCIILS